MYDRTSLHKRFNIFILNLSIRKKWKWNFVLISSLNSIIFNLIYLPDKLYILLPDKLFIIIFNSVMKYIKFTMLQNILINKSCFEKVKSMVTLISAAFAAHCTWHGPLAHYIILYWWVCDITFMVCRNECYQTIGRMEVPLTLLSYSDIHLLVIKYPLHLSIVKSVLHWDLHIILREQSKYQGVKNWWLILIYLTSP